MYFISLNMDKVQRNGFYEMSKTLLASKINQWAGPGCDTFDSVESHINLISQYFATKFEILYGGHVDMQI